MIYTRFFTEVKVLGCEKDAEGIWLKVLTEDGREREWSLADFKADNGLTEIIETVREVIPADRFAEIFPNSAR